MKVISVRKSGSTLLTVLLLLAALGSITILATRNSLTATRSLARTDNASAAEQMAQSGIDEGLLRLKKVNGQDPERYYGNPGADVFNPTVMRRGFKKGTNCSEFLPSFAANSTRPGDFDTSCPYYDLAIRNYARVQQAGKYRIEESDLIVDQPLTLELRGGGGFTVKLEGATGVSSCSGAELVLANCPLTVKVGNGAAQPLSPTQSPAVTTSGTFQILRKQGASLGGGYITLVPTGSPVVETPHIYVESRGYVGGVQRALLVKIPRYTVDLADRIQIPLSSSFDENGFLQ